VQSNKVEATAVMHSNQINCSRQKPAQRQVTHAAKNTQMSSQVVQSNHSSKQSNLLWLHLPATKLSLMVCDHASWGKDWVAVFKVRVTEKVKNLS